MPIILLARPTKLLPTTLSEKVNPGTKSRTFFHHKCFTVHFNTIHCTAKKKSYILKVDTLFESSVSFYTKYYSNVLLTLEYEFYTS